MPKKHNSSTPSPPKTETIFEKKINKNKHHFALRLARSDPGFEKQRVQPCRGARFDPRPAIDFVSGHRMEGLHTRASCQYFVSTFSTS